MNQHLNPSPAVRNITLILTVRSAGRLSSLLLGLLVLFGGAACQRQESVRVKLQARTPSVLDLSRLEVRAQVAGVQVGLRYKWIANLGECDPQESEWPATIFHFADGTVRDRVTVEVWRGKTRLAHEEIALEAPQPKPAKPSPSLPAVQVEITTIPPFEPHGGPDTRADISGRVTGEIAPDYKVVLYARADEAWYIQPAPYVSVAIQSGGTWSSWTHTGSHYAALVVRPGFMPALICDVLPQVGGDVLARVVVEGSKK